VGGVGRAFPPAFTPGAFGRKGGDMAEVKLTPEEKFHLLEITRDIICGACQSSNKTFERILDTIDLIYVEVEKIYLRNLDR
jgi:hypothetical protein